MVLGPAQFLILVLVPLALGAAALRWLGISLRTDRVAYFGWAWMIGSLGIAALELVRLLLGVPAPGTLVAAALLCAAVLFALGRRRPALAAAAPRATTRAANAFFAALLALCLLFTLVRIAYASTTAVTIGDEAIFWSRKAKLLFESGSLGGSYASAVSLRTLAHADYPALNPLLQLWVFDLAGRITHVVNRVPIQLVCVALVLCASSALRRAAGAWIGALLLILIPTCFQFGVAIRLAQSDALVALGGLVALDGYLRWKQAGERAWLGLAGLGAAFLCWSKHEGLLVFAAFIAAALLTRAFALGWRECVRPRRELLWLLPALGVLLVTWLHNRALGTAGSHATVPGLFDRLLDQFTASLGPVLRFLAELAVEPASNAVPAVFLLLALFCRAAWREPLRIPTLAVLFVYVGLAGIYVTTRDDLEWLLVNSAQRVFFQTVPLSVLWIGHVTRALLDGAERAPAPELSARSSSASARACSPAR